MSSARCGTCRRLLGCESCGLVSLDVAADDVPPGMRASSCPRCDHVAAARKPASAAAHVGLRARRRRAVRPGERAAGDDHDAAFEHDAAHAARRHPRALASTAPGAGADRLHRQHRRAGAEDRRARPARLDACAARRTGAGSSAPACTGWSRPVGHWSMLDVYVVVLLAATACASARSRASQRRARPARLRRASSC